MNVHFDPRRSEAMRAGLVAEASPAAQRRHPWRGLALVLAGVLVGSGATTAAFANGKTPTPEPFPPAEAGSTQPPVVVVGSTEDEGSGGGRSSSVVVSEADGRPLVEYEAGRKLRMILQQRVVLSEPEALDLTSRPANATFAWVSMSCRGAGTISMVNQRTGEPIEFGRGGSGGPGGLTVATIIELDGSPDQVKPTSGCTADATVTYYAQR